jgi:hypothetical protein
MWSVRVLRKERKQDGTNKAKKMGAKSKRRTSMREKFIE